ncbi:MAG TPA: alpha/beta fold hydrolase [Armatimonadota bacterium]
MANEPAALLLLHGFPLDARMWRRAVESFGAQRDVIAPNAADLFHGEGSHTIAAMADRAAALLNGRSAVVCGLSMGGYVAQELVKRHPGQVVRLVLCDTRAAGDTEEARANRNAMIAAVREKGVTAGTAPLVSKLLYEAAEAVRTEVTSMVAEQNSEVIVACIEALRDRADNTGLLADIAVPTLVVSGEHDALSPPEIARALTNEIRNARLALIPASGHVPPMENPRAFNEALANFLAGQ